jgi:hypothetical protein
MTAKHILVACAALSIALFGEAFVPLHSLQRSRFSESVADFSRMEHSTLWAASGEKKRRRRKQPPSGPGVPESTSAPEPMVSMDDDFEDEEEVDISMLKDIANFKFDGEIAGADTSEVTPRGSDTITIPLPDIKDTLRKKELEEEMARIEEAEAEIRVKIKRSDKKAMAKVRIPCWHELLAFFMQLAHFQIYVYITLAPGTRSIRRFR